MLNFKDSFFSPELRQGFYIPERMKRAWAANLKNLCILDKICHQLNICYFIDYGTLLGAVRHQGYIPWDDDVDISMLRRDYMRFLKEAPSLLPDGMHISSYYTEESHLPPQATLMNRYDVGTNIQTTEQFFGCPFITGMDILPLDYIPTDPSRKEEMMLYYSIFYDVGKRYEELEANGELDDILSRIRDLFGISFDPSMNMQRQFYLEADKIAMNYATEEMADSVVWMPDAASKGWELACRKEWYKETQRLPFENLMLDAPIDYDSVLSTYYGPDYMTSFVKGGADHDYPFYQKQIDFLKAQDPVSARHILSYAKNGDWGKTSLLPSDKETILYILRQIEALSDSTDVFPECQQIAIDIGTFIENNIEKPKPIVTMLELYCEALYQCSAGICESEEIKRIISDIKEAVLELP